LRDNSKQLACLQLGARPTQARGGNFSIFFFDTVKERLLAPDFSEVGFGGNSLNPATKITVTTGKPTATIHRAEPVPTILDATRRKAYGTGWWFTDAGTRVGLIDVDLSTKTAKYIDRSTPLPAYKC